MANGKLGCYGMGSTFFFLEIFLPANVLLLGKVLYGRTLCCHFAMIDPVLPLSMDLFLEFRTPPTHSACPIWRAVTALLQFSMTYTTNGCTFVVQARPLSQLYAFKSPSSRFCYGKPRPKNTYAAGIVVRTRFNKSIMTPFRSSLTSTSSS